MGVTEGRDDAEMRLSTQGGRGTLRAISGPMVMQLVRVRLLFRLAIPGLCCSVIGGCSGGGTPTSSEPPPPPGFTLSISPSSLTLNQGGNQTLQVEATAVGGFSGSIALSTSTVSGGITLSPSSATVTPGSPTAVQVSASGTASISQQSITFSGTSGLLSGSATLQLTVQGSPVPDPFHYVGGAPQSGFFDESRQLLFLTNIGLNELDVITAAGGSVKARVVVPQPMGIDQMADGKTLVIGTDAQEIVTVDEDTLAITIHPYAAPGNGALFLSGAVFFPEVAAMANGKVLLVGGVQGTEDAAQPVYEWNPTTDTFTQIYPVASFTTLFAAGYLARSTDRKWAVFVDYGSSDQFYLYSSDQDSFSTVPLNTVNPPSNLYGVRGYALNSDGSVIAVASATEVSFFDRSFNLLGTAPLPSALQYGEGVSFSADGSKLYLAFSFPPALEEVDVGSYTTSGYLAAAVDPGSGEGGNFIAADAEGHAYFAIFGGIRVVSLSQNPIPNPTGTLNGSNCSGLNSIAPLNTSEQVAQVLPLSNVSVYVGGQPATVSGDGMNVSVPASSSPGPADVECIDTQGNTTVMVQGVSYGVDPVALSANLLPPTGSSHAYVFGFGFSTESFGAPLPTITVGGLTAPSPGPPQPLGQGVLEAATIGIPNASPGTTADINVVSSLGSGRLAGAATYYPTPTIVPASGVLQLTFDTLRNRLYVLKATEVDVLDATQLQWLTPLAFPANFTGTVQSMGLTPDGSKLAVLAMAGAVPEMVVLDPAGGAASVTAYTGYVFDIVGSMAITNLNQALLPGTPGLVFDLTTLAYSSLPVPAGQAIRASADGTHVYSAVLNSSGGTVYSIDPSTFAEQTEGFGYLFWTDLAVSPDGSHFAAVDAPPYAGGDLVGFFDSSLRLLNANAYPDYSPPDDSGVLGATYSPGGQVVLVPLGDSIEFWDANTGTLRARLMAPEELQVLVYPENGVAPMLALNAAGDTIFAASKSGVSVIPLPGPIDQMPPMQWPYARGSGFIVPHSSLRGTMAERMRGFASLRAK
jgi:hypothetical protein